jgi:hypothetical protein
MGWTLMPTETATDQDQRTVTPNRIAWSPQEGPQTLLMICPHDEIFYGGARGGGKTSGLLGHWLKHQHINGKHARGLIVRQTYPELKEIREQSDALFPLVGAHFRKVDKEWVFRNGAKLLLGHLDTDKDAKKVLGQQYSWQGVEEITNWPTADPIKKLKGCLRSAHGIRCQWVATGNPGGVGHNWVKEMFIDPMPPGKKYIDPQTGVSRVFIPAKLSDNKILMSSDPSYANRLKGTGPDWLVQAWLDGNWNIVAGGMFDDLWDPRVHVLEPFTVPRTWTIDRAFDWGSSRPFSLGWWATANGDTLLDGRKFVAGSKIRIAEYYGWDGKTANKGCEWTDAQIVAKALAIEADLKKIHSYTINAGPADSAIFAVSNGTSTAANLGRLGLSFKEAAKGPGSRVAGWSAMRNMFHAAKQTPWEHPGLFVFNTCRQFIRTVPSLPRDSVKVDDVDTDAEDHIGDETRYELSVKKSTLTVKPLIGV